VPSTFDDIVKTMYSGHVSTPKWKKIKSMITCDVVVSPHVMDMMCHMFKVPSRPSNQAFDV